MAATLQTLSGGRFVLGIGAGWRADEYAAYGYDFPSLGDRMNMAEEALELVSAMLSQERTTHRGIHFQTHDAANLPQPVRPIPLWVGGTGEQRTPRLAATFASGWNVPYVSPDHFAHLNTKVDEACERRGRDPGTLERSVNIGFYLATSEQRVAHMEAELREQTKDMPVDFLAGVLLATPERAVERIMQYVEAGAGGVNIALRPPVDEEALAAYLEHVVPAVRAEAA